MGGDLPPLRLLVRGVREAGKDPPTFSPTSCSSPEPHLELSLLLALEVQALISGEDAGKRHYTYSRFKAGEFVLNNCLLL